MRKERPEGSWINLHFKKHRRRAPGSGRGIQHRCPGLAERLRSKIARCARVEIMKTMSYELWKGHSQINCHRDPWKETGARGNSFPLIRSVECQCESTSSVRVANWVLPPGRRHLSLPAALFLRACSGGIDCNLLSSISLCEI